MALLTYDNSVKRLILSSYHHRHHHHHHHHVIIILLPLIIVIVIIVMISRWLCLRMTTAWSGWSLSLSLSLSIFNNLNIIILIIIIVFIIIIQVALLTYDDSVKRLIFGKKLQNHDVITGLLRFSIISLKLLLDFSALSRSIRYNHDHDDYVFHSLILYLHLTAESWQCQKHCHCHILDANCEYVEICLGWKSIVGKMICFFFRTLQERVRRKGPSKSKKHSL